MKKNPYDPPKEIILNGEIVKFHYNREDRLKMGTGALSQDLPSSSSSLFSRTNRHKLILILNLVLITVAGVFFSNFFGKNRITEIDGLKVALTRKQYSNGTVQSFQIQIRNKTNKPLSYPSNYMQFSLKKESGETFFKKDIFISKLSYTPDEFFMENITINHLEKGQYRAQLQLTENGSIHLDFTVGKKKRWQN